MSGHFYQESIFTIDRLINDFTNLTDIENVVLEGYNYHNRCFNSFIINEKYIDKVNIAERNEYLEEIQKCLKEKEKNGLSEFLELFDNPERFKDGNEINLYSLFLLYSQFPLERTNHVSGFVLRKIEEQKRIKKVKITKSKIDVFSDEYWPTVQLQVITDDRNSMKFILNQDTAQVVQLDAQYPSDNKLSFLQNVFRQIRERLTKNNKLNEFKEKVRVAKNAEDTKDGMVAEALKYYSQYLEPLFLGQKIGEQRKEIPAGSLVALPFYDAKIDNYACGMFKGLLFLPENGRNSIPEETTSHFTDCVVKELTDAAKHEIMRAAVVDGNVLKDFLRRIVWMQNWERVVVFSQKKQCCLYCFTRCDKDKSKEGWPQEKHWVDRLPSQCNPKCGDIQCFKQQFSKKNSLEFSLSINSKDQVPRYFYFIKLEKVFDYRLLPSLKNNIFETEDKYRDIILGFEFPGATIFPPGDDGHRKLGHYYFEQLFPVLDRMIESHAKVRHSIKSASTAIISRNHSHHIGSHITPRISIDRVLKRLQDMYGRTSTYSIDIVNSLKARMDEYVLKKADFMAEIATAPLITTVAKSLFKEVMAVFIHNTLFMDNIGANESVNYVQRNGGPWENRLRVNFRCNGKDTTIGFKEVSLLNNTYNNLNVPYGVGDYQFQNINGNDVFVAWPGPLGEYAFYAFLENFIRNAVKHNYGSFKDNPNLNLDVFIEVSSLPDKEGGNDFFRVEVWDNVTKPDVKAGDPEEKLLVERLQSILGAGIVESDGSLKNGNWGLVEMKIMATLLRGSTDFTDMDGNLKVTSACKNGKKRLVYEFRLMKAKAVAIVAGKCQIAENLETELKKNGIYHFKDFKSFEKEGAGSLPSGFEFVVLDPAAVEEWLPKKHLMPSRVLAAADDVTRDKITAAGALAITKAGIENFPIDPGKIKTLVWKLWAEMMFSRSGGRNGRVAIFFEQKHDVSPTKEWLALGRQLQNSQSNPIRLSTIYTKSNVTIIVPLSNKCDQVMVFDRHGNGRNKLRGRDFLFYEMFDKSSLDFTPIYSAGASEKMLSRLVEAACLKILFIDERVAEIAHEKIAGLGTRIGVCRDANIFIATHLNCGGNEVAIHEKAEDKYPRLVVDVQEGQNNEGVEIFGCYKKSKDESEIKLHFDGLVLHQGVAENEKLLKKIILKSGGGENCDFKKALGCFICKISNLPYITVDSGRGIPSNLPETVKFLPFSLISDYVMKNRIAKYSLVSSLMTITRRESQK